MTEYQPEEPVADLEEAPEVDPEVDPALDPEVAPENDLEDAPGEVEETAEERTAREDELLAEEPDPGVGLPRDEDGDIQTGHPAVDEVLRSLGALDATPVDEHVAVFEQAHEQLRRTLSGAGDDQA